MSQRDSNLLRNILTVDHLKLIPSQHFEALSVRVLHIRYPSPYSLHTSSFASVLAALYRSIDIAYLIHKPKA